MKSIDTLIGLLSKGMNRLTAVMLHCLMLFIAVQVILRYAFNAPIKGYYEIAELMTAIILLFSVSFLERNDEHVDVDLFTSRLPQKTRLLLKTTVYMFELSIAVILCWQIFVYGLNLMRVNDYTPMLGLPKYLIAFALGLALAVLCCEIILKLLRNIKKVREIKQLHLLPIYIVYIFTLLVFAYPLWISWFSFDFSMAVIGGISFIFLILGMFSGFRIAFAMALTGLFGMIFVSSETAGLRLVGMTIFQTANTYSWCSIPLFLFMALMCGQAGLSKDLFSAAYKWVGAFPGGVAIAAIAGCAIFAAISGDTLSTAITMGSVSLPALMAYKYDESLSTGSIAVGGTLGAMIPPSIGFIVFAQLTEQSIGKLFMAGVIPGIILASLFALVVIIQVKIRPEIAPRGEKFSLLEKLVSLKKITGVIVLLIVVLGGIYTGIFSPIESSAIGALMSIVIAAIRKEFTWRKFLDATFEAVKITNTIFLIFVCAAILSYYESTTRLPIVLAEATANADLSRYFVLALVVILFFIFGCLINAIPMMVLLIPIVYPVLIANGFDPLWIGVFSVLMAEVAVVTPPVGVNVFAIKALSGGIPMEKIFKGVFPFLMAFILMLVIMAAFPRIATFLPSLMK